nr:MAG TPA: hypothetical protein [Microviridae sp.]
MKIAVLLSLCRVKLSIAQCLCRIIIHLDLCRVESTSKPI